MRLPLSIVAAASALLCACGAAPPPTPAAARAQAPEPRAEQPPPPSRQGSIARDELDRVIEGGLGRFLAHVQTEPHLDDGRFVGFRVVELNVPFLSGVDLAPGDTLLSINGLPIERPEQALAAWNGLRVASELTVEYLREGERHQLRFAIEETTASVETPEAERAAHADASL